MSVIENILLVFYYILLTITGNYLLWGLLATNGTLPAFLQAKKSRILPDGTKLRVHYTGNASIDSRLTSAVVFYNGLLNGMDPNHGPLQITLHESMQTTSFCVLVACQRGGPGIIGTIFMILFGITNQAYGAAVIYPATCAIAFLLQCVSDNMALSHPRAIPYPAALALVFSSIFGSCIPLILFYPLFRPCSPELRQALIAWYRFTPVIFSVMQNLSTRIIQVLMVGLNISIERENEESKFLVLVAYSISALVAAAAHVYAITTTFRRNDAIQFSTKTATKSTSLVRIFYPEVRSKSTRKIDVSNKKEDMVSRGTHLFLQWDMYVIGAAFLPVVYILLNNTVIRNGLVCLLGISGGLLALGPGATLAGGFAIREWYT